MEFESHEVSRLQSVAHLFPRSRPRCGIYVLHFTNGDRYVGQTTNVVARFGAHRKRWGDIAALNFSRVPTSKLDVVERELIHSEQKQARIRNVTHALATGLIESARDIDVLITPDEQHAWLNHDTEGPDTDERVDNPGIRSRGQEKYARLAAHEFGEAAEHLTRLYVQLTVPRPRATELTFWAASAMPSTNASTSPRLVAISINKMETFVLGSPKSEPDYMYGFLNVSKQSIVDRCGSVEDFASSRSEWLEVDEVGYEAGGGDVLALHTDAQGIVDLLAPEDGDTTVVDAARRLNLMLMRKGPTLQWRFHCFDLADRLLQPLDSSR